VDRWRQELLFPRMRNSQAPALGRIRSALEEHRVLRMLYHTYRRPEPESREVEPISLVFLADAWHLSAYCRVRQAARFFRLDRIDDVVVLSERFAPAERHVVPPHRSNDGRPRVPEARVRFDASVERWVRERQPFFFLREETDLLGSVFVYAVQDERA